MRPAFALLLCLMIVAGCQNAINPSTDTKTAIQPHSDPEAINLHFSETKELVLSIGSMKYMLDLDTDHTMDPPADARRTTQQMDVYPTQEQPYQLPEGLTGILLKGIKVKSSDWNASILELRDALASDRMQPLTQMNYKPEESATYFFRTQNDTVGILQLLALVDQPKGIRIRYKVLVPSTH